MLTIISGTDRPASMTLKTANIYLRQALQHREDVRLLSLENRAVWQRDDAMVALKQEYLVPADKFIFIIPEYNGSYPGILKMLLDNTDIKECWWYKKALLVGVSDGRNGNLRGLEHFTAILHYLKMHVHYSKVSLPRISEEIDSEGRLLQPETEQRISAQVADFMKF